MQIIKGVRLTDQQAEIYRLIKRFGRQGLTDHALVGVAQHEMPKTYSESGIRTRRRELVDAGLLALSGSVRTRSGREAARWRSV